MSADYGVLSRCSLPLRRISQDLIIYIPNISKKIQSDFISDLFKKLNIAKVGYVHLQEIDNLHNAATVYMDCWHNNQCVENLQEKINNPNLQARLIYDDPEYWVLYNKAELFQESTSLADKITHLENKLDKTNEMLEVQTKELQSLSKSFEQLSSGSTNKRKMNMLVDNSCCGAASDAWVPSYPQVVAPTNTTQDLPFLHWRNRLRMRVDGED